MWQAACFFWAVTCDKWVCLLIISGATDHKKGAPGQPDVTRRDVINHTEENSSCPDLSPFSFFFNPSPPSSHSPYSALFSSSVFISLLSSLLSHIFSFIIYFSLFSFSFYISFASFSASSPPYSPLISSLPLLRHFLCFTLFLLLVLRPGAHRLYVFRLESYNKHSAGFEHVACCLASWRSVFISRFRHALA